MTMLVDTSEALAALDRLVRISQGDTGQSRRVANFLLAWWNATDCGGFDFTDLWNVDTEIADDMILVIRLISISRAYPDSFGYKQRFEEMVEDWRPALVANPQDAGGDS